MGSEEEETGAAGGAESGASDDGARPPRGTRARVEASSSSKRHHLVCFLIRSPHATRARTHTRTHTRTRKHARTHTHTCTHTHTYTHICTDPVVREVEQGFSRLLLLPGQRRAAARGARVGPRGRRVSVAFGHRGAVVGRGDAPEARARRCVQALRAVSGAIPEHAAIGEESGCGCAADDAQPSMRADRRARTRAREADEHRRPYIHMLIELVL